MAVNGDFGRVRRRFARRPGRSGLQSDRSKQYRLPDLNRLLAAPVLPPKPKPRDAFLGYDRRLTREGGVLITFIDQKLAWYVTALRPVAWLALTCAGAGAFVACFAPTQTWETLAVLITGLASLPLSKWPIKVAHSVEIRHNALIIDGKYRFERALIGDHWPIVKQINEEATAFVLCGIYGIRYVEYATVNRVDENDRTPERLSAELKIALDQLWGRTEVTFDPPGR